MTWLQQRLGRVRLRHRLGPGTPATGADAARPDSPSVPTLFDQAAVGVTRIDARSSRFIEVNRKFADIVGYRPDELIGREGLSITHPEDRAASRQAIERLQAGEVAETTIEKRHIRKDGRTIWVSVNTSRLSADELMSVVLDITASRQADQAVRAAERDFRAIYENIGEGIYRSTIDGRMISGNPSLVRLNGYAGEAELLAGVNDIASEWYVEPGRRAEFQRILFEKGRVEDFVSEVYRHKTRERIWVSENARLVRDEATGEPVCYEGSVREITATVQKLELQARFQKMAATVPGCLYQFRLRPDRTYHLPYASAGLRAIFGVTPEAVAEDSSCLVRLIHEEDREAYQQSLRGSARTLTEWRHEFRINAADGREKWLLGQAVPEREADGSTLWHGVIMDVTERKRAEARIHDLAFFDPLTRLPNRAMLHDRLRRAIAASNRSGRHGAVLFIDLDNFKMLNDTKGHDVGDLLLVEVAQRLQASVRVNDIVARLGGDEFVVLLQDLDADPPAAATQANVVGAKILAAIDQPCTLDEHLFQTTPSIGIALFNGRTAEMEELLKRADLAMYDAKAAGRNAVRFFDPAMQAALEDRLALISDLRRALREGQFALHYQVQVDDRGRPIGAEALLRWEHPSRGAIPPSEFIRLAEENGLSEPIHRWSFHSACAALKSWAAVPELAGLRLSVNISASQFRQSEFVAGIRAILAESGADPTRLTLELTEHVMLDDVARVADKMHELKALGVGLALDDFGTGYSSLSYLKRLPLDEIKIDQSFVRDIGASASDETIVRTVIGMARSLGMTTIAEGVESHEQLAVLFRHGCQGFQGYLFGCPLPLRDLEHLLRRIRSRPEPAPDGRRAPV